MIRSAFDDCLLVKVDRLLKIQSHDRATGLRSGCRVAESVRYCRRRIVRTLRIIAASSLLQLSNGGNTSQRFVLELYFFSKANPITEQNH